MSLAADESFRQQTAQWLAANLPPKMRTPMPEHEIPWGGRKACFAEPETQLWLERMVERGWTAPHWPREYGGAGLSMRQAEILNAELKRLSARPALFSFGLWMLGPVLLEYASEEQLRRFLPPIVRGEIRWAQGYSEPEAGSDLAALRTRAEDQGDHWRVNGQKVWTSYADEADWMFCLVRTGAAGSGHAGISFLLFDLQSPGITVRPIRLISGSSPFCEVFFDDVRVPKENLVGRLNGGWEIAKKLLQYERQNVSAVGFGGDVSTRIENVAKRVVGTLADGSIADRELRARVARHAMHDKAVQLTMQRAQRETDSGQAGALSSIVKVLAARNNQAHHELMIDTLGLDGLRWQDSKPGEAQAWLRSKGNTIEGGTTEINLNVIAKRILGLPSK